MVVLAGLGSSLGDEASDDEISGPFEVLASFGFRAGWRYMEPTRIVYKIICASGRVVERGFGDRDLEKKSPGFGLGFRVVSPTMNAKPDSL